MKKLFFTLVMCSTYWMLYPQTATAPAVGDGSAGNPYQIATAANLYWITANNAVVPSPQQSERWTKFYLQTADIDLTGYDWTPIGIPDYFKFYGAYNGQGYSISGLNADLQFNNAVGMFGTCEGASIQNIHLISPQVSGATNVGVLIGVSEGCTVSNCSVEGGMLTGSGSSIGGLIGNALRTSATLIPTTVTSSTSSVTVFGGASSSYVGGLIGSSSYSSLTECSSNGIVNTMAASYVGGLIGMSSQNTLSTCYSTGGSSSTVSGKLYLGGLIGQDYSSSLTDCYSLSNVVVNGEDAAFRGGLIGATSGSTITTCFSAGAIAEYSQYTGGLIGANSGTASTVTNSFWDVGTSLWASSAGGSGLSTELMKTKATFEAAGWDLLTRWDMDGTTNNGYLHFMIPPTAVAPAAGSGTAGNPYQISNLNELYWITTNSSSWNKYFVQTADIDAHQTGALEKGWIPIGPSSSSKFTGRYNGAGFTIDKLYSSQNTLAYVGLFGYCEGAELKNIGLSTTTILNGGASATGALVAASVNSNVFSCYSTGSVSSNNSYVGGLVGSQLTSRLVNSFSRCAVQGVNYIGGLLGSNGTSSLVKNSYSTGTVSGTSSLGGLVGANTSAVSQVSSFWDSESSGIESSAIGTAKSTAELKDIHALQMDGWNFQVIWDDNELVNNGYPSLKLLPDAPVSVVPVYSGGVYLISSLSNLVWIAENSGRWGLSYKQTATIDASATAAMDNCFGWTPIGNSSANFTGSYDGQGFTISNLSLNRITDYNGLFGYAAGVGKPIKNIRLENVQIKGNNFNGAISGQAMSKEIHNCSVSGYISGLTYVGAVTGYSSGGTLTKLKSTATVFGSGYIGGIVGKLSSATIKNSFSGAEVRGAAYIGGIAGYTENASKYIRCYAYGPVSTGGGLVGTTYGTASVFIGCFYDTEATGRSTSVGGSGKTTSAMKTVSTYTDYGWNFSHQWELSETNNGYPDFQNYTTITPVASQPAGAGTEESPYEISTLNELLWIPVDNDAVYVQTADIDASETALWYDGAGWMPNSFYGKYDGQNYVIRNLFVERFGSNTNGLFSNLYPGVVLSNMNLENVSVLGSYYTGALSGYAGNSSGIVSVSNCKVSGGYVGGTDYVGGFFGRLYRVDVTTSTTNALVHSLTQYGGGIGGEVYGGSFKRCFTNGKVEGASYLGGIAGKLYGTSYTTTYTQYFGVTIENCFNKAFVSGTGSYRGGLVGYSYGMPYNSGGYTYYTSMPVVNSYNVGAVPGGGGLIGGGATGVTVTNSFWDRELAGTNASALGGTSKTTAEMKTLSTYTGWDFVNETANGTNDYWKLDLANNDGYPWLTWQELPLHWVGGTSADWSDAANWDGSEMPVATTDVVVVDGTFDPVLSTDAQVNHLTIISGQLKIAYNGALTVNGDLTTVNDGLKLESSISGTGTIITKGNVSGRSIVQQFLQGRLGTSQREWWYISSPVSGALSAVFNPEGGLTKIGSYSESAASYPLIPGNNTSLFTGAGYVVKINDIDKVYEFSGVLHTGDYEFTPLRTGTSAPKRGFNLMGNPYPSYLNWDLVYADEATTNMRNALWFRTYDEVNKVMTFHTYADGDGVPSSTSGIIAPMQAFWVKVHADGSNGALKYSTGYRAHKSGTSNPLKVKAAELRPRLRLEVSNGTTADETLIVAKSYASDGLDAYDVEKMSNDNPAIPELYSLVQNQEMVINSMCELSAGSEVKLGFRPGRAGEFTLKVTQLENIESEVVLLDISTGSEVVLGLHTDYRFSSDADVTNDRFKLEFRVPGTITGINDLNSGLRVFTGKDRRLVVQLDYWSETDLICVYNLSGQQLVSLSVSGSVTLVDQPLDNGIYIVRVNDKSRKIVINN